MDSMVQTYAFDLQTIYVGGGTPSVLDGTAFAQLSAALNHYFSIPANVEWTMEANPESVSHPKVAAWYQAGVNRVSLGVQSLQNETLHRMQRLHDAATVTKAVAILKRFPAITYSMDVIAGYPGVREADWTSTVAGILDFSPALISLYECTLHPRTQLQREIAQGSEQEQASARRDQDLEVASKTITAAGYEHYEISNFCLPGKRCRHNTAVWHGEDYVGLGPSASSRVGQERWTNHEDLYAYIQGGETGHVPRETDTLSPTQNATERLIFAFRVSDPVNLTHYLPSQAGWALTLHAHWKQKLETLQQQGLVRMQNNNWYTTPKGRQFVDLIAETLLP